MALYRAFIDDSASEDSLFRDDLTPKPIQKMDGTPEAKGSVSKAAAAGIIVVRGSHMDAVQREVLSFRWDLKRKYKLPGDTPPKLHMRHLWGKQANTDQGRNPFAVVDERERLRIARRAYQLLDNLGKKYDVRAAGVTCLNEPTQQSWEAFFTTRQALINREIIYSRFRGGQHARRFYARITNPTMSLVAELVTIFGHFLTEGNHQGVIRYDTSDASKGFDADEVYDAISDIGWCRSMIHSSHGAAQDDCLLQLADLVSFAEFRGKLNEARGLPLNGDPAFASVMRDVKPEVLLFRTPPPPYVSIGVHYLAARQFLYGIDSQWVETHLKTPAELVGEFEAGKAAEIGGIHIVRQESYDHYVKHGRLPQMSRSQPHGWLPY